MLTRNDQSLAAHDENDLQGPKLLQTEPPTLEQGPAEFGDERGAEEADADGHDDVGGVGEPVPVAKVLCGGDCAGVDDGEGEAEADCQQGYDGGCDDDGCALRGGECRADGVHLQDEGDLDAGHQQEDVHGRGD